MALEKDSQKRIRRTPKGPRVAIGLDVDADDAMPKREIPFVLGVLASLSGHAEKVPFKEREAYDIDRENFDAILAKVGPILSFAADSALNPREKISANLQFKSMEDFEPQRVAEQISTLKAKLEERRRLWDILSYLSSNGKLSARLQKAIETTEERERLRLEELPDNPKK